MIQVVVNDSSCLIDLRKAGLLTSTLLLPFRFVVAQPLIAAELHDFTAGDWNDLQARGLQIIDLEGEQVGRAFEIKARYPGLSSYDCFSIALAEASQNAMLLTGDQQLRRRATAIGIEVHGVLWVADQIEQARIMPSVELADALERLADDPLVFIPNDEVNSRIERLRR